MFRNIWENAYPVLFVVWNNNRQAKLRRPGVTRRMDPGATAAKALFVCWGLRARRRRGYFAGRLLITTITACYTCSCVWSYCFVTDIFGVEEVLIDETRPPYVLLSLTSLISVYILLITLFVFYLWTLSFSGCTPVCRLCGCYLAILGRSIRITVPVVTVVPTALVGSLIRSSNLPHSLQGGVHLLAIK